MSRYCPHCDKPVSDDEIDFTGRCPWCEWPDLEEPTGLTFYTNAPQSYDYGCTKEIIDDTGWRVRGGMDPTNPVREIMIADDYHAGIQKGRNGSGLYVTLTLEEYGQWISGEFLVRKAATDA